MNSAQTPTLMIVSGMSGAGKTVALNTFEDLGFYCVDNLPVELLPQFVRSLIREDRVPDKLAVGIDVRNRYSDLERLHEWLPAVRELGLDPKLLFLDTSHNGLLQRYAHTRRRHPLSRLGLALDNAIERERAMLAPLRESADATVDTSDMNVHQLRKYIITEFGLGNDRGPSLLFESFAYKHGLPPDADFVLDARVLPNPHWDSELRPLSGRDAPVRDYLDLQPDVKRYVAQVSGFLDAWLPQLKTDTRSYITVAFGCTGGRHRSVYLAERLAQHARENGWSEVAVHHRELD